MSQPAPSDSLRKCIFCGVEVPRRACHKNRYGEYICRDCQRAGRRMSPRRRLRRIMSRAGIGLVYLAAALVALWLGYKIFAAAADLLLNR